MDGIFSVSDSYLFNTYNRFRVAFEKGEGVYLYDYNGRRYIDFLAGIAVVSLGHSHSVVVDAIKKQAEKLIHTSNLYYIKQQAELAKLLTENSCCNKAFFVNSGAEANETAIKLVRKFYNPHRFKILSFKNSFHGRTLAALSATGQDAYKTGFEPLVEGFNFAEFNNIDDAISKIDDKTAAVLVEFIQGEGGINVAKEDFIKKLYSYCKDKQVLFVADEVQTGAGRTGKFFAYEHYDVEPDVITLAKGIGGGVPIGVVLAKENVAKALGPSTHGSTFGGNQLSCSVAEAVVKHILSDGFLESVKHKGEYLISSLKNKLSNKQWIVDIRGLGLMIGVELDSVDHAKAIINKAFENSLLIGRAGEKTIRLEPPLIVEKSIIDEAVNILDGIIQ